MVQQVASGPKGLAAEATLEQLRASMGPHVGKSQRSVLEVQIAPFKRAVNLYSDRAVYTSVLTASVLNEAFIGVFVVWNDMIYILPLRQLLLRNFGCL